MNSLNDLNSYNADTSLSFTDQRLARVIFNQETATPQTKIANEGSTFTVEPGIEILDIIDYAQSLPTLTLDFSAGPAITLDFGTLPAYITVTEPSDDVYLVSGMRSSSDWDLVKSPDITLTVPSPNGYNGTFVIDSYINYNDYNLGAQVKSWQTVVTVLDVTTLTNPLSLIYITDGDTTITNPATINDIDSAYPGATFTVTLTPTPNTSVDTISSAGSGGTVSFNGSTKVLTITGSRTQVNSHLNSLTLTSNTSEVDFVMTYASSNNQDDVTDSKSQLFRNSSIAYLANPTANIIYYTEDSTGEDITDAPLITDTGYLGSGDYTITIAPDSTAAVVSIGVKTAGIGGTSSFNNTTKTLTITGTKAEVNFQLGNLQFVPASDVDYSILFSYTLTTPLGIVAVKVQQLLADSDDQETSNLNITRRFVAKNGARIFETDTPQIVDLDVTGTDTYTIEIYSTDGYLRRPLNFSPLGYGALGSSVVYSGDRATVNAQFEYTEFWPLIDFSSTGTIRWTQYKNGVLQFVRTFGIDGEDGDYPFPTTYTITASGTWTPNIFEYLYGRVTDLVVVGGGGGGAEGGGGGGGGVLVTQPNLTLANQSYSIVVGGGGLAGNHDQYWRGSTGNYRTWDLPGGTGGTSSAFGYSAFGGKGGENRTYRLESGTFSNLNGGNSGATSLSAAFNTGGLGMSSWRPAGNPNLSGLYAPSVDAWSGDTWDAGGGGAGAGGAGGNSFDYNDPTNQTAPTKNGGGVGGAGVYVALTDSYYGGGGAGVSNDYYENYNNVSSGGVGGGGRGGHTNQNLALPGTANTGGGGGGGGVSGRLRQIGIDDPAPDYYNAPGGSGVVIFRIG